MAAESRIGRIWAVANPFAGPARRRADWIVDGLLFVIGVLVWLWAIPGYGYLWAEVPGWWVRIDLVIGALSTVGIWWRRRYPVLMALLIGVVGGLAMSAWFPILVAIYTVAANRAVRTTLALTAIHLVIAIPYYYVLPAIPSDFGSWTVTIVLLYITVVSIGLAVRSRRQVIANLVAAAERERQAHREQLGQARQTERSRIAREMHDVLAHRISLLSVHAGALEYRTRGDAAAPLTPAELGEAVRVIRATAHRALEDLRDVLAVLEPESATGDGTEQPQPNLSDVPQLVAEARAAGQQVRLSQRGDTERLPELREPVQRTLYRVVQEGLTNARKHTPGACVEVELAGRVADCVRVSISNPLPVGLTRADIPGAGRGLTGLAERVRIDGGVLRHDVADGAFRLSAELPWRT